MPVIVDEDIFPDIRFVIFHKCTPAWEIPRQKLETCNLTYLIQGAAQYTINGETVDLEQGNLLMLPKGATRRGITFPNQLMHCFSVDFTLMNTKNQELVLPFPAISQPGRHEDVIHLLHDLSFSWQYKQPGYIIKARGLFLQIFHRFLELIVYKNDVSITDPRIAKSIRYLSAHYSERITVRMMANMAGLNPTYFGLLFKQETGVSFNRYLIQTRIRNAEDMLASGEYKIGNIAEACGFTDTSHFYKQFKLVKGFPPSYHLPKKF
ncbi:MAG: AraC family transcriptional regulator [Spirochaetaceae bacterium]|jgi:AraC-like DNA-binding protein|nr:AraC family transcriptional regulator [Spirochaetaceae bacterium]